MSTHLLTGFPGFIGRRLVAELLQRDSERRVVALVEDRMLAPAQAAADEIDGTRIELIAGDISARRLGLADADYERLAAEVTVVHHLAAIYDLAVPIDIAQRVNVDGTGNVVEFCKDCEKLERHQGFKNHYESTKFQAEVWVREEMDRVPTTIYRPAIVVGDSRTGQTQKFDGPYYVLRFIAASKRRHLPVPNIGRGVTPFNVVPVDFIVDSIAALAQVPEAVGETVHLCDPSPLSAHDMFGLLSRLYSGSEPMLTVPAGPVAASLRSKAMRRFFGGVPRETIRYMNHPVRYDTRRATELLAAAGLTCPGFASYAPKMVEFFQAHEDDAALLGSPA
jgi:thioester reductase-like protein